MKLGQMEIIGLVVIVILFVFGGLIYLTFMSKPPDNSMAETRQSAEVANLLNSMMKLTPCPVIHDSLDDIIRNCYISPSSSYCDDSNCTLYIESTVLNATSAYSQNTSYIFTVKDNSAVPFISLGSCSLLKKMAADSSIRVGNKILRVGLVSCLQ